jgi:RHS repeat-associated protein
MSRTIWQRLRTRFPVRSKRKLAQKRQSKCRPRLLLYVEPLEEIVLLSAVTWINAAGGDWDTAANWQDSNGVQRLPGAADDVIINVPGGVAITHALNQTDTVASLSLADPFTLSSGTLTINGALSSTSTLTLTGGTLSQANIQAGTMLNVPDAGNSTLDHATLAGTALVNGHLNVTQGVTLAGGLFDVPHGSLPFQGDQTIGGTGEIHISAFGVVNAAGNVVFGPMVTVHGTDGTLEASGGSLTNQGTISAGGGAFSLGAGGTLTNDGGTIKADGGQLTIVGNWSNTGQIILTATAGSSLTLGGSFTTAGMGTITPQAGTINVVANWDNTNSTFGLNAATGSWNFNGGTLTGGKLTTADGAVFVANNWTVDQVTLAGTILVSGHLNVTHGLILENGLFDVPDGSLFFQGDQTLSGTGAIHMSAFGAVSTSGNVTFGPTITVHGITGTLEESGGTFTNQGTISAESGAFNVGPGGNFTNAGTIKADGGQLTLSGNWSNTGQIIVTATAGSSLTLGGSFITASIGTITPLGGPISVAGNWDNTNSTFALNAATGSWNLSAGTITGGTLATADGAVFVSNIDPTLDHVKLAGTIRVTGRMHVINGLTLANGLIDVPGGIVNFTDDQTFSGPGEVHLSSGSVVTSGKVAFGPDIIVHATNGTLEIDGTFQSTLLAESGTTNLIIGSSFINQGTIDAPGGILNLNSNRAWTGKILTENGKLNFMGNFSFDPGLMLTNSGGVINILGTLDNTGQTLTLDDSLGIFLVDGGTIRGGVIKTTGTNDQEVFHDATLDGVTIDGTLNEAQPASSGQVTNGLTLDNGIFKIGAGARFKFLGTQLLGGTGTVVFMGNGGIFGNNIFLSNGSTLTIGPGIFIHGQEGKIDATGGALINQGAIAADGGDNITVVNAANFSGGTLTGGTWQAAANSTLRIVGANITTNAANLTIDGAGSHIYSDSATTNALAGLGAIAAGSSLALQNGATESSTAASFSNAGALTVGANSVLTLAGGFTQSAGSTAVDGTISSGGPLHLNGGALSGSGTIQGAVINAGQINPGNLLGTLTVTGNYTQASTGTTNIEIGGATAGSQYDRLHIQGTAALDGTLHINLVNGFGPSAGQDFTILDFASATGSFATINGLVQGGRTIFRVDSNPTSLVLHSLINSSDLSFTSMSIPTTAAPGQAVTVTYTAKNLQSTPAVGDWYDSVYLTTLPVMNPDAQLLGRVHHVGDVAGGASYTENLTAPLPNLGAGNYHFIVIIDSRGLTADLDRSNNTGVSSGTLSIAVPMLTIGTPTTGTIASGQDIYYRLVVPPGQDVNITALFSTATEAEFYVRYGTLPDRSNFDQTATDLTNLHPTLSVANAQGGDYFILLHGREGAGAGQSFSLEADAAEFAIASLSVTRGSNQGDVTTGVIGTRFTAQTTVTLTNISGAVVSVADVEFVDSQHLNATFHLQRDQVPEGSFNVRATDNGVTVTAAALFQVSSGSGTPLSLQLLAPAAVRIGAAIPVTVNFDNAGGSDIPMPIIELKATGVPPADETHQFFASNGDTLPGFLPPESNGSVGLAYDPPPGNPAASSTFNLVVANPSLAPMDWDSMKDMYRPSYVGTDAWDAVWSNFRPAVGNTLADFYVLLRNDATHLAQSGDFTNSIHDLLQFELSKAADNMPTLPAITSVDLSLPALGFPLLYGRSFGSSLYDRFRMGRLGRGWTDTFDISATLDSRNIVTVRQGDKVRFFGKLANGTYVPFPGELTTLAANGNGLALREPDGMVTAFRADGSLDYMQDTNGNRITAGYTGSQLTSIAHSDGSTLTFTYNSAGLLAQVADSSGRVATYAYDANERLISVTTPLGTTSYTYTSETAGPHAFAVTSVATPLGTHVFYTYDSQGRLASQQHDGGAESLTYIYGVNGYSVTDALSRTSNVFFDHLGRPIVETDALGHIDQRAFDDSHNLVAAGRSGGAVTTFAYDVQGNPIASVDPLGQTQSSTYDSALNRLTSWKDGRDNTTLFGNDSNGNLLNITYPDTSAEHFGYDAHGNIISTINRSGQAITFTYDPHGLLLRKTYADGTHVDYTYNAQGAVITATDSTGTTTIDYDGASRLTKIAYPSGRFLVYTYDAGGRRASLTDQDGFGEKYSYDAVGRPAKVTDAAGTLIVSYTYDGAGQLIREDRGNGTHTTYDYDAVGNLLHLVHFAPDNSIQASFTYTYDELGRQSSVTTADGTTSYSYDILGRLTGLTLPGGRTIAYEYDAAGNRTTVSDTGVVTSYSTNALNQYTSVGSDNLSYDQNGNLISDGSTTYTYDAEGRLTSATSATDSWTYVYDAFGNRSTVTHNGQTTHFLVDPTENTNAFAEYDRTGQLIAHNVRGRGLAERVEASGQSLYYGYDSIGNTAQVTGSSGRVLNRYSYLPFGEALTTQETVANPYTFGGQNGVVREGGGLYFMRHRSYNPALGRFVEPDHIGLVGGPNFYTFANNNPVTSNDPSGYEPFDTFVDIQFIDTVPDLATTLGEGGLELVAAADAAAAQAFVSSNATFLIENFGWNGFVAVARAAGYRAAINAFGETAEGIAVEGGLYGLLAVESVVLVWALGSIGYAAYLGHPPDCPEFFPGALNFITACDAAPISSGPPVATATTVRVGPHDPNELFGPGGFGPQQFVQPNALFPYIVYFENDPHATAPAQQVIVTEQLGPNLDWSTFELGTFGFGAIRVQIPSGRQVYHTRLDERASLGLFVDFTASFNPVTSVVTWTLTSLDPATLDLPINVLSGFLPPDDSTGRGQGFVTYFIRTKAHTPTGTIIQAKASVVFDTEAPIATPQFTNTIDAGPPTSTVQALPATTTAPSFLVSWSGQDDAGGSGIASFDVFVSDNGGPFAQFLTATTQTSATFTGQVGHTYGFYSVATDNVGHVQPTPAGAQASTTVTTGVSALTTQQANQNFVDQLYHDLLGRPADSAGLAAWTSLLEQGSLTRGQVVGQIIGSQEYETLAVGMLYEQFLHRPADATGLGAFVQLLAQGGSAEQVEAALLGSGEYFTTRGSGTNAGFLGAVYQDVLHRAIDPAGLQAWQQALASGSSRATVASAILNSREAETDQVQALYQEFLHRDADAGGLSAFVAVLQRGTPSVQVSVALLGSAEYALNAGGNANAIYVGQLYQDLLGRQADPVGLSFFTGLLDSGTATRASVVQALTTSEEFRAAEVQKLYKTYLHRQADPSGLGTLTAFLKQGGTNEQAAALLAGSPEYFQNRGGGTNAGFLGALYQDALGRAIDPTGLSAWQQALTHGTSPAQVATAIFSSPEYQQDLVGSLYQTLLRRPADPGGLLTFSQMLAGGTRDEEVISQLVVSLEYFGKA